MLQTERNVRNYKVSTNYQQNKTTKKRKLKGKTVIFYCLFLFCTGLVLVLFISQTLQMTQINYQINKLNDQLTGIEEHNHRLNLELAESTSLAKIEKYARQQLHMNEPEKIEYLVLNNYQTNDTVKDTTPPKQIYFLEVINNLWKSFNTVKAGSPE